MRKNFEIPGLVDMDAKSLLTANGGIGSTQSAAHSQAKSHLTTVQGLLTTNGANQHAYDAVGKVIGKLP